MGTDRTIASHGTDARPSLPADARAERARVVELVGLMLDGAMLWGRFGKSPEGRAAGKVFAVWLAELQTVVRSGGGPGELRQVQAARHAREEDTDRGTAPTG